MIDKIISGKKLDSTLGLALRLGLGYGLRTRPV